MIPYARIAQMLADQQPKAAPTDGTIIGGSAFGPNAPSPAPTGGSGIGIAAQMLAQNESRPKFSIF